ncbi:MAG: hypothetical protein R2911_19695 [Caldilineaceae bacterium]
MMPMFYILAAIVVIAAGVLFIIWALQIRIITVPQEERLIIYRWGRFQRVAGPGPVWVIQAFEYEQIMRTINVRDQDRNFVVGGLFSFDIPFGFILNLWYRYDPLAAAQGDADLLLELAQHSDDRYAQIAVKLREALVRAIMVVQKETKLVWEERQQKMEQELTVTPHEGATSPQDVASEMSILEKLMMVVPGMPSCERILDLAEAELAHVLPSIGVILNRHHRITVTKLDIADDLIGAFSRDRIAKLLRGTYQSFSDAELARGVARIEGLVESVAIEGEHTTDVQTEWRESADGLKPRFKHKPRKERQPSFEPNADEDHAAEEIAIESAETAAAVEAAAMPLRRAEPVHPDWWLSPSDLEVLKTVPPMPDRTKRRKAS